MKIKAMLPTLRYFTAGLIVGWLASVQAATPAARKPNIVFVLADDLGYGRLGCYGQRLITTPHLDRLAAEGARFSRFYAGSSVCAPSRSVLMTGLHTGHTRVHGDPSAREQSGANPAEGRSDPG